MKQLFGKMLLLTAITVLSNTVYSQLNLTFSVTQLPLPQVSLGNDSSICEGATLTLNAGNAGSIYHWGDNSTVQQMEVSTAGTYSVTVTDTNACTSSDEITIGVNPLPVVDLGPDHEFCYGNSITLYAGSFDTYAWSNGAISDTLVVNATGNFNVSVTDNNGCMNVSNTVIVTVRYPNANDQICIVLVDSTVNKNMVVWEKTPDVGTASYVVYKLSGIQYIPLDTIPYESLSTYIDYSSVPQIHADRYKISVIDTCGNESALSPYVQTISLGVSQGIPSSTLVLSWNSYEDESADFIPSWYYIYRGTSVDNLELYDSISSAFLDYNDINVFSLNYYAIVVTKSSECTPTSSLKEMGGPYSQSFSNIEDNALYVSARNTLANNLDCKIYPNPANDKFFIELSKNGVADIVDLQGRIIKSINLQSTRTDVETQDIMSGVYTIRIITDREIIVEKLIIE